MHERRVSGHIDFGNVHAKMWSLSHESCNLRFAATEIFSDVGIPGIIPGWDFCATGIFVFPTSGEESRLTCKTSW